jgi:hypothetical protein
MTARMLIFFVPNRTVLRLKLFSIHRFCTAGSVLASTPISESVPSSELYVSVSSTGSTITRNAGAMLGSLRITRPSS